MQFFEGRRKFCINELKRVDLFVLNRANQLRSLDDILQEINRKGYKKVLDSELYQHMISMLKVVYNTVDVAKEMIEK